MAATKSNMAQLDDEEITTEKIEEFILKVSRLLPKVTHYQIEVIVNPLQHES